jgi:hypothetical protein
VRGKRKKLLEGDRLSILRPLRDNRAVRLTLFTPCCILPCDSPCQRRVPNEVVFSRMNESPVQRQLELCPNDN